MIVYFYDLNSLHLPKEKRRPLEVYTKYFESLENIVDKFNELFSKQLEPIDKVYNEFGQEIPLNYRIQRTGLEVYFVEEKKEKTLC